MYATSSEHSAVKVRHAQNPQPSRGLNRMPPDALRRIRERYKPDAMRVLLLGESPPPYGFFYRGDSTLFRESFSRLR
jgi:hypothetical protein